MSAARPSQSIHKVFAENLRLQCARFASIAELCRLADINRQQFNRYLSGQNLPNPRTLERLAAVLEVSEAALFETPGRSQARTALGDAAEALEAAGLHVLAPLIGRGNDGVPTDLRSGYYYCYAPLVEHPDYCVRMLIHVVNDGQLARFTRRTSFTHMGETRPEMQVGKHDGIIVGDVHGALLVGRNKIYPHEFSAFRVQRPSGNPNMPRAGLALLRNSFTDIGSLIALHYVGDGRAVARQALKNLGVTRISDPLVPQVVVTILTSRMLQDDKAIPYILAERDATLSRFRS